MVSNFIKRLRRNNPTAKNIGMAAAMVVANATETWLLDKYPNIILNRDSSAIARYINNMPPKNSGSF